MNLESAINRYAGKGLKSEIEYFMESQVENEDDTMRDKTLKEAYVDACDFADDNKLKAIITQGRDIDIAIDWLVEVSDERRANTITMGGRGPRFIKHKGKFYDYRITNHEFLYGAEQ